MYTFEPFFLDYDQSIDNDGIGVVNSAMLNPGDVSNVMRQDPGLSRPYRDEKGRIWVDVTVGRTKVKNQDGEVVRNSDGSPKYRLVTEQQLVSDRRRKDLPVLNVNNATTLTKDQWIQIDAAVMEASRKRMRAWSDLRAARTLNLDGMGTTMLEYERINDIGEATVDMDGISEGKNFAPHFTRDAMPLPVTHCDFHMSQRFLESSRRNGGQGANVTRAAMAGRRVGETLEQTLIGTQTGIVYGDNDGYEDTTPAVTGYTNDPNRITKTSITAPTGSNGTTILTEWLDHRDELYQQNFYGPYTVYVATSYDQHLDNLFSTSEPSAGTLRDVLMKIDGVQDIRRLDYLTTSGTTVWAELGGENLEAVNGMEITTVQWVKKGGLELCFKVMTIQAPRIKAVHVNTSTTGAASATTLKAPVLHCTT